VKTVYLNVMLLWSRQWWSIYNGEIYIGWSSDMCKWSI